MKGPWMEKRKEDTNVDPRGETESERMKWIEAQGGKKGGVFLKRAKRAYWSKTTANINKAFLDRFPEIRNPRKAETVKKRKKAELNNKLRKIQMRIASIRFGPFGSCNQVLKVYITHEKSGPKSLAPKTTRMLFQDPVGEGTEAWTPEDDIAEEEITASPPRKKHCTRSAFAVELEEAFMQGGLMPVHVELSEAYFQAEGHLVKKTDFVDLTLDEESENESKGSQNEEQSVVEMDESRAVGRQKKPIEFVDLTVED